MGGKQLDSQEKDATCHVEATVPFLCHSYGKLEDELPFPTASGELHVIFIILSLTILNSIGICLLLSKFWLPTTFRGQT